MRSIQGRYFLLGAAALAAFAVGCSRTIPKPSAPATQRATTAPVEVKTVQDFTGLVNHNVIVRGQAVNGNGIAAVTLNKYPVYLANLKAWAPDLAGQKVEVTGKLVQKRYEQPNQSPLVVFMIEEAQWKAPQRTTSGPAGPTLATGEDLRRLIGAEIRVRGIADNAKMGAVVNGNGLVVYVSQVGRWPKNVLHKKVEVSGTLAQRTTNVSPIGNKERIMAPAWWLDNAKWELAAPPRPAARAN